MALRLVEITVSEASGLDAEGLAQLFDGQPLIDSWEVPGGPQRRILRLLVDAGDTEPLLDLLNKRYAGDPRFRVVLLPVEGTLPLLETAPEPVPEPVPETKKSRPGRWRRVSREELYADLGEASEPSGLFVLQVVLSTAVAAVGLMAGSVAVLIGAMVIAPLLGPNVALAFGATLGDLRFMRRAVRANVLGLGVALLLSILVGATFAPDPTAAEIASRTGTSLSDIVLALAAGIAGTLAFTSGASASLIGVMVAVALLPPLVSAGILLGSGHLSAAAGAFLLLATNVICVNLAAVATFALQGVRPSAWWQQEGARRSSRAALLGWTVLLMLLLAWLLLGTS